MSCRLLLVRHGEPAAYDVVPGHRGCPGLSGLGTTQAAAAANALAAELDAGTPVYSSVIRRAVDTAAPIAAALGVTPTADCRLCELHDGEADGVGLDEVAERWWKPANRSARHMPWNPNAPGAESILDLTARAGGMLHALAIEHDGGTVVVVTHGGVIRASYVALGNLPVREAFGLQQAHTSITEWVVDQPAPGATALDTVATLVRADDTAHLARIG